MKELRVEGESGSGSLATEKIQSLVREHHHHQNRDLLLHQHHQHQHQHNLVTSGLPSPTQYLNQGISSLLNTQALSVFGADPAMLSAHLLASIAASNAAGGGRFQIPLSIPLGSIPVSNPQLFPHHHHLHHHVQAGNVDILSNWVKEQQAASKKVDQDHRRSNSKISSSGLINKTPMKMKNTAKDPSNWSVSKANKRNKNGHNINNNNDNITNNNHHHLLHKNGQISVNSVKVEGSMGNFRHELDVVNEDDHIPIKKEKNNSRNGGSERDKVIQKNVQNANNNNNNNKNSSSMIIESNNNIEQQLQPQSNRDKVFICPICNRCFGYKHVLQNHERTHTGEKPFECTICHKKFTRDHHLKTHMRLHTGEKPYKCTHCERQFVQVANLRRHLRVHTGERPYACEICSSRFSDSNQLKAHNLIHKGEKPYSCDDCGGRFRRRHHLAHHKCKDNLTIISSSASTGGSPPFHSDGKETISPPSSREKHERKPRETRRILRFGSTPVSSTVSHSPVHSPAHSGGSVGSGGINIGGGGLDFIHGLVPEQTVPEDLSLSGGNVISRNSNFSGSCSASGSPSPHSGGSNSSSLGGDFY